MSSIRITATARQRDRVVEPAGQDTTQLRKRKTAPRLRRLSDRPIPTRALEFDCPRCLELNALPPQGSVFTGFDPQTVGSRDRKGNLPGR